MSAANDEAVVSATVVDTHQAFPLVMRSSHRDPATMVATILLVEDDCHCRAGLRRQLVRSGFDVCEAANGMEALHLLRTRKIDAVATDIFMPTMGGLALIGVLTEDPPRFPIVAYSGADSLDPEVRECLASGNIPFLHKPFSHEAFVCALREVLRRVGPATRPWS